MDFFVSERDSVVVVRKKRNKGNIIFFQCDVVEDDGTFPFSFFFSKTMRSSFAQMQSSRGLSSTAAQSFSRSSISFLMLFDEKVKCNTGQGRNASKKTVEKKWFRRRRRTMRRRVLKASFFACTFCLARGKRRCSE